MASYGSQAATAVDALRQKILVMHPGVPLPPAAKLIRELSVSRSTLVSAYDTLGAEGLLERIPRKGVFVADRSRCGDIAIVVRPHLMDPDYSTPFYRRAVNMLVQRLQEENSNWNVRVHSGRSAITEREFASTLDLTRPDVLRHLRG